jgi:fatty-acyl-CoA synthase
MLITTAAQTYPEREAVVVPHQDVRLTYRKFAELAQRVAWGLAKLGLQRGDRVGVWACNCVEWLILHFSCALTGLVLVNVNPAYRSVDLAYVLRKSRIRALFLWEQDVRANYRHILGEACHGQDLALEYVIYFGQDSWSQIFASPSGALPEANPEEVANIQYTSGTTGSPKGVLLTHRSLVNNAWGIGGWLSLQAADRVCVPLPLYHCAGCVCSALATLVRGAALILPSPQFDARAVLSVIGSEQVSVIGAVPTMLVVMLEHPEFESFDLSSLRVLWTGGSPCPVELMHRVRERMRVPRSFVLYGQTEASPLITMAHPDDSIEQSISSIGRAILNTEVKIISTISGELLPVGEQGELCTRGYHVMKGYDEEPDATACAIDEDGWLHTGDLAVMDPDEHFHITGRAKDMIIRGGENLFPAEIEAFLVTYPKVAEVCVVGLPDQKLGESVLAWIRLRAGMSASEEEIAEFCHGKIAHFKIPQYIRFVDAFPMTVSGKIQRFRIRELEIEKRGLQEIARVRTA